MTSKALTCVENGVATANSMLGKLEYRSTSEQRDAHLQQIYSGYRRLKVQAEELHATKKNMQVEVFQSNRDKIDELLFSTAELDTTDWGDWDTWKKVNLVVQKFVYGRSPNTDLNGDALQRVTGSMASLNSIIKTQADQIRGLESTMAGLQSEMTGLLNLLHLRERKSQMLVSKNRTLLLQLRQMKRELDDTGCRNRDMYEEEVVKDFKLVIDANKRLEKENMELRAKLNVSEGFLGIPIHGAADLKSGAAEDLHSTELVHSLLRNDQERLKYLFQETPIAALWTSLNRRVQTWMRRLENEVDNAMGMLDYDAYQEPYQNTRHDWLELEEYDDAFLPLSPGIFTVYNGYDSKHNPINESQSQIPIPVSYAPPEHVPSWPPPKPLVPVKPETLLTEGLKISSPSGHVPSSRSPRKSQTGQSGDQNRPRKQSEKREALSEPVPTQSTRPAHRISEKPQPRTSLKAKKATRAIKGGDTRDPSPSTPASCSPRASSIAPLTHARPTPAYQVWRLLSKGILAIAQLSRAQCLKREYLHIARLRRKLQHERGRNATLEAQAVSVSKRSPLSFDTSGSAQATLAQQLVRTNRTNSPNATKEELITNPVQRLRVGDAKDLKQLYSVSQKGSSAEPESGEFSRPQASQAHDLAPLVFTDSTLTHASAPSLSADVKDFLISSDKMSPISSGQALSDVATKRCRSSLADTPSTPFPAQRAPRRSDKSTLTLFTDEPSDAATQPSLANPTASVLAFPPKQPSGSGNLRPVCSRTVSSAPIQTRRSISTDSSAIVPFLPDESQKLLSSSRTSVGPTSSAVVVPPRRRSVSERSSLLSTKAFMSLIIERGRSSSRDTTGTAALVQSETSPSDPSSVSASASLIPRVCAEDPRPSSAATPVTAVLAQRQSTASEPSSLPRVWPAVSYTPAVAQPQAYPSPCLTPQDRLKTPLAASPVSPKTARYDGLVAVGCALGKGDRQKAQGISPRKAHPALPLDKGNDQTRLILTRNLRSEALTIRTDLAWLHDSFKQLCSATNESFRALQVVLHDILGVLRQESNENRTGRDDTESSAFDTVGRMALKDLAEGRVLSILAEHGVEIGSNKLAKDASDLDWMLHQMRLTVLGAAEDYAAGSTKAAVEALLVPDHGSARNVCTLQRQRQRQQHQEQEQEHLHPKSIQQPMAGFVHSDIDRRHQRKSHHLSEYRLSSNGASTAHPFEKATTHSYFLRDILAASQVEQSYPPLEHSDLDNFISQGPPPLQGDALTSLPFTARPQPAFKAGLFARPQPQSEHASLQETFWRSIVQAAIGNTGGPYPVTRPPCQPLYRTMPSTRVNILQLLKQLQRSREESVQEIQPSVYSYKVDSTTVPVRQTSRQSFAHSVKNLFSNDFKDFVEKYLLHTTSTACSIARSGQADASLLTAIRQLRREEEARRRQAVQLLVRRVVTNIRTRTLVRRFACTGSAFPFYVMVLYDRWRTLHEKRRSDMQLDSKREAKQLWDFLSSREAENHPKSVTKATGFLPQLPKFQSKTLGPSSVHFEKVNLPNDSTHHTQQ